MLKKSSTLLLKITVSVLGLMVLALAVFALPTMWKGGPREPELIVAVMRWIVVGMYATMVPFYIALWNTFKLLKYIDNGTAFSINSVRALRMIKFCGVLIGAVYMIGVPLLYPIAQIEDAPGIIVIGFAIACTPIIISVFAAVLQRLLENVIEIKSENELTV